jgi:hypothetical protein
VRLVTEGVAWMGLLELHPVLVEVLEGALPVARAAGSVGGSRSMVTPALVRIILIMSMGGFS